MRATAIAVAVTMFISFPLVAQPETQAEPRVIELDSRLGYGVSADYWWAERISTETSVQSVETGTMLGYRDAQGGNASILAIAQWHFNREGVFAPYAGAGVARMTGRFVQTDAPPDQSSFQLQDQTAPAFAVGANVRLTQRLFLTGEVKYIAWNAVGGSNETAINPDPLVATIGVKLRF